MKKLIKIGFLVMLVFIAVLTIISCNKNSAVDSLDTNTIVNSDAELLNLLQFANTTVDGRFGFTSQGTFASQSFARGNSFQGYFHTPATLGTFGTLIPGFKVKVGESEIQTDQEKNYSANYNMNNPIWGSNQTIALQENQNASSAISTSLRVPKLLEVNTEMFNNFIGYTNFPVGSKLFVNKDVENERGIMVTLEYLPTLNDSLREAGYTQLIRNAIVVNETGIVELNEKLFANIPANCIYKLTIGRRNTKIVTNSEGKKYALYAYVYLTNEFKNQ